MKNQFQAKDIQKLVEIPKYRYEYIASKIGIKPEIEEVEKTGHTHLYSFKNLLEFAIVNTANSLGIGPKATREILIFLSNNLDLKDAGLFDLEKKIEASIHYADTNYGKFFKLSGASVSEQGRKGGYTGKGFDKTKTGEVLKRLSSHEDNINVPGFVEEYRNLSTLATMSLEDFDGFITINLGKIKNRLLKKLK